MARHVLVRKPMMRARMVTAACFLSLLFVSAGASAAQTGARTTPAPAPAANARFATRLAAMQARTYRPNSARPPGFPRLRAWALDRLAKRMGLPATAQATLSGRGSGPQAPGAVSEVPTPAVAAPQWHQATPPAMTARFKSFLSPLPHAGRVASTP